MKRLVLSIIGALTVPMFFWLGGYDFDSRGAGAVMCALYTLLLGAMVYFLPVWSGDSQP